MEEEAKKGHLESGTTRVLILWAAITDLLTLIPVVGDIADPFYWRYANKRIEKDGVKMSSKAIRIRVTALIIKLIPVLQELPATIVGIIIVIMTIKAEEKLHIPVSKLAGASAPLNNGGRREPSVGSWTSGAQGADSQPYNFDGTRQPTKSFTGYGAPGQASPYGQQTGPYAADSSFPDNVIQFPNQTGNSQGTEDEERLKAA